jgi:molybdenum cofactor cytidylyltransferase
MIAAIVPAAGRSERMGRPKLILPVADTTLIARVVSALRQGGADPVVVVTPPRDAPGAGILIDEAAGAGAVVVVAAERPADMRASFALGLARLADGPVPEAVLLVPADSPGITAELVACVVARACERPRAIVVPTYEGRRGHPVALPWALCLESHELPPGVGLNALVKLHAAEVHELPVAEAGTLADLDTPEDYERWPPT